MRRRLIVLSLATTLLVVVAFLVPLGLLVRRQAIESAKVAAERDAQSVAGLVALALALDDEPGAVSAAIGDLPEGTIVVLGLDDALGAPLPGQGTLAPLAAQARATISSTVEGGWEVALPVVGSTEVVVVDSFVTDAELTAGVAIAWTFLVALGVVLVGVAVWLADRMGRSLTAPIEALATSAHRLAAGDLETRVEPSGPEELVETGVAFNYLAERLVHLLAEERESAADLSHRLRTPLTSLRLQAEALVGEEEREAMIGQVNRLEHAMNQVIELARSRAGPEPGECALNRIVEGRAEFWGLLAEEQGREVEFDLDDEVGVVPLRGEEVEVIVDSLIGNVFTHTPPGTSFEVRTGVDGAGVAWLEIADRGPGFAGRPPGERGVSGGGSTGLGLDIVRKTAKAASGEVVTSDRPSGGAVVRVYLG